MLFAALLAPAILAGGLLAGELVGYDAAFSAAGMSERQAGRQVVAERHDGPVAFEAVAAPAPPHADRTYRGLVPAPVGVESREPVAAAVPMAEERVEEPVEARRPGRERPARQRPVRRSDCPVEWAETWLWELCQEYQRRQA